MQRGVAVQRTRSYLTLRLRRALPRSMNRAVAVTVLAGYGLIVVVAAAILIGWRGPSQVTLGVSYWPVQALLTTVTLGVISTAVTIAAVRSSWWPRLALSGVAIVLALVSLDALPLGPGRLPVLVVSLVASVGALVGRQGSTARESVRCLLASVPFVVGLMAQLVASDIDRALVALQNAQLIPTAAIGLGLLAVFAIASSVEQHRERASRVMARSVSLRSVVVVVVVKLAVLGALYLHLTGDFLGGEPFWRPRLQSPLTWVHAAVIGGIVAYVAVRSRTHALTPARFDFQPRLRLLSVSVGVAAAAGLLAIIGLAVVNAVNPGTDVNLRLFAAANWVVDNVGVIQFVLVGTILVAVVVELAVTRRLTAGRYLWLVAGLWLLPPLFGIAFDASITAWAAPGQVDAVITLAVLVIVLVPRWRHRVAPPRVLMTLLVVPAVVLHLVNLWPSSWTDAAIKVLLIGAVMAAVLLDQPPVTSNIGQTERTRTLTVAGQLGILVAYYHLFGDAELTGGLGSSTTIAWLWLAVPTMAVLTARVRP